MEMMETGVQRRGGFIGFLTTIPGILTALAALLTAAGGVYVARDDGSKSTSPNPNPVSVNLTVSGGAAPTAPANVDQQALRLDNASGALAGIQSGTGDPVQQLVDQCGQGSVEACSAIIESLIQECAAGYGVSCDVLYALSPVGSEYEAYGATCGYRYSYSPDIAGYCEEI